MSERQLSWASSKSSILPPHLFLVYMCMYIVWYKYMHIHVHVKGPSYYREQNYIVWSINERLGLCKEAVAASINVDGD